MIGNRNKRMPREFRERGVVVEWDVGANDRAYLFYPPDGNGFVDPFGQDDFPLSKTRPVICTQAGCGELAESYHVHPRWLSEASAESEFLCSCHSREDWYWFFICQVRSRPCLLDASFRKGLLAKPFGRGVLCGTFSIVVDPLNLWPDRHGYSCASVGHRSMRAPIKKRVRFSVLERDRFRCVYCGLTADESQLHVDHVFPRSKGGDNDMSNLVTACPECNLGKSDTVLSNIQWDWDKGVARGE